MRTSAPKWLAMVVAGSLLLVPHATRAGVTPAGTWAVEGVTTVSYNYEGHHARVPEPFAARMVVHDDGTIDGEVIEPNCGSDDPVTFTARRSNTGRVALAAGLRAFAKRCYAQSRLKGVRANVRVSDDGTRLHGVFRGFLRLPLRDAEGKLEPLTIRLRGVFEGRRDE